MAAKKQAKAVTAKSTGNTTASSRTSEGFTAEERAAMRERARELKASGQKQNDESAVLARIAEMPAADRKMAERIHAIVKASVPGLSAKLWYGMPAYAKGGDIICFFQDAQKFKSRYGTLGFRDRANLDDGQMWPVAFALKELSASEEARIGELVKKAAS